MKIARIAGIAIISTDREHSRPRLRLLAAFNGMIYSLSTVPQVTFQIMAILAFPAIMAIC